MRGPDIGRSRLPGAALWLATLAAACGTGQARVIPPAPSLPPPEPVTRLFEAPRLVGGALLDDPVLADFYGAFGNHLAWGRDSSALLSVLAEAATDGLDPTDYRAPASDDPVVRDVALTRVALRHARDLSLGRVSPITVDSFWRRANEFDPAAAVVAAIRVGRVADLPALLRPPHTGYAVLRPHLAGVDSALVAVNLERWRWLPRDMGRRYVIVNIPAAEAVAVEGDTVALATRVIVGRPDWPTPILAGTAERLVFSPTWTVPPGIVRAELLPAARRDSLWLSGHGYRVFAGSRALEPDTVGWAALPDSIAIGLRFVMAPGPANPLGDVKLPFANPFSVALHDTPERGLFADSVRVLSHGCVRVERMADLAAWLLAPSGWPAESVAALVHARGDRERVVPLAAPIPVYLTYFTAEVDPAGKLIRHPDPYGWDPRLVAAVGAREGVSNGIRSPPTEHTPCEEES